MKRLILIFGCMLMLLCGCSREKTIDQEDYLAFQTEIQEQFEYIEDCRIYFNGGPAILTVSFNIEEGQEDYEACFEMTKAFLLSEGTLDLLDLGDMQYYPIRELSVDFISLENRVRYYSEYYKAGPEGYQDNRYWTEDNADHFETWWHDITSFTKDVE